MAILRVDHDFISIAETSLALDVEVDVNVQYITARRIPESR